MNVGHGNTTPTNMTITDRIRTSIAVAKRDLVNSELGESDPEFHNLERALEWTFRSQDAVDSDGSSAGYNLILGWEKPYPETTGYIIPSLYSSCDLLKSLENQHKFASMCEDRANRMVNWLLELQLPGGAYPAGKRTTNRNPSVFNSGQILLGLCAYIERFDDTETAKQQVRDTCNWLVDVQNLDGSWDTHDYNSVPHAYSSRVAWPMLLADELLGLDPSVRESAKDNLDWVVNQQTENNWFQFAGFKPDDDPFLHTIAYTIRGLLEAGILLEHPPYLTAAKDTADHLLHLQDRDGFLKGEYDAEWRGGSYHGLTGNAQMAIIWSRLYDHFGGEKYLTGLEHSVRILSFLQTESINPSINGAIKGSHPIWGSYMYLRYPNWATKFYIDSLLEYDDKISRLGLLNQ